MIAKATLCMSLQLSLVTGGVDSLINDLVCDFAVPTSHDYTRAVWFERETPSSLRPSAKFDSLYHEITRDCGGAHSWMVLLPCSWVDLLHSVPALCCWCLHVVLRPSSLSHAATHFVSLAAVLLA